MTTDFRLPWWLTADDNSVLECLYCVDVDIAADVLEVHAASVFRVGVG
jgi:hypothetical protein